jgi:hypothetical protein
MHSLYRCPPLNLGLAMANNEVGISPEVFLQRQRSWPSLSMSPITTQWFRLAFLLRPWLRPPDVQELWDILGCLVAVQAMGHWNASFDCEGCARCQSACMVDVFLATIFCDMSLTGTRSAVHAKRGRRSLMVGLASMPTIGVQLFAYNAG